MSRKRAVIPWMAARIRIGMTHRTTLAAHDTGAGGSRLGSSLSHRLFAAYRSKLEAYGLRTVFLVALCVAAGGVVRAHAIVRKPLLSFDEASSYLAASCHQDSFERAEFGLSPVEAGRWKRFLKIEDRLCFRRISADLSRHDVHPPFYFWVLHVWSIGFGVHVWSGTALNVLIATLTTIALFFFTRSVGASNSEATLVALTYTLSSAAVSVSLEARPYDLMTLLAVLAVYLTVKASDRDRELRASTVAGLALAIAVGSLTHYHFVFVSAFCLLLLGARLLPRQWKKALVVAAVISVALLVAVIAHPPFDSLQRHSVQTAALGRNATLPWRFGRVLNAFDQVFYAPALTLGLCVALAGFGVVRRGWNVYLRQVSLRNVWPLFCFVGIAGPVIAAFMLGVSQPHAMGPKYLSMAMPFLAFLPILILRLVPGHRPLVAYLFLLPLTFGLLLPVASAKPVPLELPAFLRESDVVLIDSTERGVLLPAVWSVPDDRLVLAADQEELIERPEEWLAKLGSASAYLPRFSFRNRVAKARLITACLRSAGYEVLLQGAFSYGFVYQLRRLTPPRGVCDTVGGESARASEAEALE